jgi:hypothetical protein
MPTNNFPNIGFTTNGRDYNFFQKYTVTSSTFGGDTVDGYQPSMIITFPTYGVIMTNLTASTGNTLATGSVVEFSLNGTAVHGELGSAFSNVSLKFENRVVSKIWFRLQSGSVGSPIVSVLAWGTR